MKLTNHKLWAAVLVCLSAAAGLRGEDKTAAERSINQIYRHFEAAFAEKDVGRMYVHCDPGYSFTGPDGTTVSLEQNRQAMVETLSKVKSIQVRIQPEASDLLGNQFLVRYRQTHEIVLPLRNAPRTTAFAAEDTWQIKNGQWRLMATKVVRDSIQNWQHRLAAQKKQMEFEDEQHHSRRCLAGMGNGCGGGK